MAVKRNTTYFGVVIPAFKEEKIGSGQITIRFVVRGSIISKKNNEVAVPRKKEARDFLLAHKQPDGSIDFEAAWKAVDMVQAKFVGNRQYAGFLRHQKPIIEEQKAFWIKQLGSKGLTFPLKSRATMSLRLYFKGRYIQDTISKQETIQDLLVECGVIADDDYLVMNPYKGAAACYADEITENIGFVSFSFRLNEKEQNKEIEKRILQREKKVFRRNNKLQ